MLYKWLNTHTSAQTFISFKKGNSRRTSVYFNLIVLEQVVTKQPQLCHKKAKSNLIVFTWTFFVLILSAGLSSRRALQKPLKEKIGHISNCQSVPFKDQKDEDQKLLSCPLEIMFCQYNEDQIYVFVPSQFIRLECFVVSLGLAGEMSACS